MDKQTAIDLLDNLLGMVEDNHDSDYDTAIKMGIDALQSNAPNVLSALDCVERQAAIDAVCEHGTELERRGITVLAVANHKQVTIDLLESLPSVQPQRWIPVTERLPENGHYYLKCTKYGNVDVDYYWDGFENATKYGEEIVAWMERPKPYKGGQDEVN